MIKKGIVFVLILITLVSGVTAAEKINLRSIRFNEVVETGIEIPFYISVKNVDDNKLKDVHITIDSPDLDFYRNSGDVDIREGNVASFTVPIEIPGNTKPGEYIIRFRVKFDDDEDRHYYRYLVVR